MTSVEQVERKFVGMRFAGPFEVLSVEMPKLWKTFLSRVSEIPHAAGDTPTFYGVSDEDSTYNLYTEFIVVEVERFEAIPYGMVGFPLPAQRYLKATHQGPMSAVQDTYRNLFQWMKENGFEQDTAAFRLERYDQRFIPTVDDAHRKENAFEILIPVTC